MSKKPKATITLPVSSVRLSEAWFEFADQYKKDSFRSAHTREKSDSWERRMKLEFMLRLGEPNLAVFGIVSAPELRDFREQIPNHFFEERPNLEWDQNIIHCVGRTYRLVEIAHVPVEPITNTPVEAETRPTIGRPRAIEIVVALIRDLTRADNLNNRSVKEQYRLIRDQARKQNSTLFPRETQPSKATIGRALAQFRSTR